MEITAQGDFGPHTQVRITEWIENVPVKDFDGRIIGRAKIGDNGVVQAVIDETAISKDLFDRLRTGVTNGISIGPHDIVIISDEPEAEPAIKYSEEVRRRLAERNPFNQEGAH